jgi:hypothetical protein
MSTAMPQVIEKMHRKVDRAALRAELLKLAGFAVLFAAVMLVTAWASGVPITGG